MKIRRFNESSKKSKASSLEGEFNLYRLTSHSVLDLSEPGEYYVCSKNAIDPSFLNKKGKDLFLITVKCSSSNIDLDKSEIECAKHGSDSIVAVKDDKKCDVISVEPYKN